MADVSAASSGGGGAGAASISVSVDVAGGMGSGRRREIGRMVNDLLGEGREWGVSDAFRTPRMYDRGGTLREDIVDYASTERPRLSGKVKSRIVLSMLAAFGGLGGAFGAEEEMGEEKRATLERVRGKAIKLLRDIVADDTEDEWSRATSKISLKKLDAMGIPCSINAKENDGAEIDVTSLISEFVRRNGDSQPPTKKSKVMLEPELSPLDWPFLATHLLPSDIDMSTKERNVDYAVANDVDAPVPSPGQKMRIRKRLHVSVKPVPAPTLAPSPASIRTLTPPPTVPSPALTPGGSVDASAFFEGGNRLQESGKELVRAFLKGAPNPDPANGDEKRVLFSEARAIVTRPDGSKKIKREQIFFKLDYRAGVTRNRLPKVKKTTYIPYSAVKRKQAAARTPPLPQ